MKALGSDRVIELEGHKLYVVEVGHSDTHNSSFLHIPSLNMVVAGDICYSEFHQWLVEATTAERRESWINGLRKIIALQPATVIASHKRPGAVDGINNCYSTINYIEDFGKLKVESQDAPELYRKMLQRYDLKR